MSAGLRKPSGGRSAIGQYTDDDVDVSELSQYLSSFQIEKLSYLFKCLDTTGDGYVNADDMTTLNELLRNIAGWEKDDPRYLSIIDNNQAFLECMLEQVQRERKYADDMTWEEALRPNKVSVTSVNMKNWLNMWSRLCRGSAGMDDFPIWVQLLPKVLFNVIVAKEGGEVISQTSLKNFYQKFAGLSGPQLEKTTAEGYKLSTANGDYKLDYGSYKLLFSNFLLGKTIYGPGKYLFGVFDNRDSHETYKIIVQEE